MKLRDILRESYANIAATPHNLALLQLVYSMMSSNIITDDQRLWDPDPIKTVEYLDKVIYRKNPEFKERVDNHEKHITRMFMITPGEEPGEEFKAAFNEIVLKYRRMYAEKMRQKMNGEYSEG